MSTIITNINTRFFEAIDYLIYTKQLAGLNHFCREHGFNETRYYKLRSGHVSEEGRSYKEVEIKALYVLAKEYHISLEWLFFQVGNMRKNISKKINDAEVIEDAEVQG